MRPCIVFVALLLGINTGVLAQSETLHTVKRGESFVLIAKRYGMTEEELKAANPDYPVCYMGLKLNIPEKYAKAAQSVPASVPASASGLSANYSQEDFVVAESSAPKRKKKKGNFWKTLGDIASGVGDVAVTVASTMDEAGLLDKTGKTGEAIGGTADMVNMLRGQESNYLASATRANYDDVPVEDASSDMNMAEDSNLPALRQRLAQVEQELDVVNQQITNGLNQASTRPKTSKDFKEFKKNYRKVQSSSLNDRRNALIAEATDLRTQIAMLEGTYEELQQERAARRQEARERTRQLKAKAREGRIKAATYHGATKAADAARDQNIDISTHPGEWIDAHGVEGTTDIIERNNQIIRDYEKKYKK